MYQNIDFALHADVRPATVALETHNVCCLIQ